MLAKVIGINRHRMGTDGNGITTLVCFHGCTLMCKYCINPLALKANDSEWRTYSPKELHRKVSIDDIYFRATNGGITFGGGEPCLQHEFINEFKHICNRYWKINIETSLNVPTANIASLIPTVNHWIVDVKETNESIYEAYTGGNVMLLRENLKLLIECKAAITVRLPLIPQYNTTEDVARSQNILLQMGIKNIDKFTYIIPKYGTRKENL